MKILGHLLLVISVFFVLSCGRTQDSDPDVKQITFYSLQLRPYFTDYMNEVIAEFEAQNPGVKVNWIDIDQSAHVSRLMMMIRRRETPDIINNNIELAPVLLEHNNIQYLDHYVDEETIDLYFPGVIETSASYNGKLHSIPWYLANSIVLFNTELMEKAGIAEEDYPTTWEEVYALAPSFREATGKFLFATNLGEPLRLIGMFLEEGLPVVDNEGNFVFYTPEAVKLLETLVSLYEQNAIPSQSLITTHRDLNNMFQLEQVAMYTSGTQFIREFRANAPDLMEKVVLREAIRGGSQQVQTTASLLSLSSTSKHPELAVEFMLFLTNAENQLEFCRRALILPSIQASVEDDFFQVDDGTLESKARVIAARQLPDSSAMHVPSPLIDYIADYFHEALHMSFTGRLSPDEALQNAYKKCQALLEEKH